MVKRSPTPEGATLFALLSLLVACDGPHKETHAATKDPSAPNASVADPSQGPQPATTESSNKGPTRQAATAPSRRAIVEAMFAPGLRQLTPESASARFAPLELKSKPTGGGSLLLLGKTAHEEVQVGFVREKGGPLAFTYLRLTVPASDGTQAEELYGQLGDMVSGPLGKPLWVRDKPPYLARGHRHDDFDVTVGAIMNQNEGGPYATVVISPGPPKR